MTSHNSTSEVLESTVNSDVILSSTSRCSELSESQNRRLKSLSGSDKLTSESYYSLDSQQQQVTNVCARLSTPITKTNQHSYHHHSKLRRLLQSLPPPRQLSSVVKEKLAKRWSADSNTSSSCRYSTNPGSLADIQNDSFLDHGLIGSPVGGGAAGKRMRARYKEHCKMFKEFFLPSWSTADLRRLIVEWDSLRALQILQKSADSARPRVTDFTEDLYNLKNYGNIQGRLPFLATNYNGSIRDPKTFPTADASPLIVSNDMHNDLQDGTLLSNHVCCPETNIEQKFDDFSWTCDSETDTLLIFVNNATAGELANDLYRTEELLRKHSVVMCHSAILSARSSFFRSLIAKRFDEFTQKSTNESRRLIHIALDESVINRRYAPVVLHTMYTDRIDLSLVAGSSNRTCFIEPSGCALPLKSPLEEATELYQIGRFLEFGKLIERSEDIIVNGLTAENLPAIYNWAHQCHGSKFVRRRCVEFLCREFFVVSSGPFFVELDESLLIEALKSDFLQANECEILSAILKWGEYQLMKRMEERESTILTGTLHASSRKGVKKIDLLDEELRDILSNISPFIRLDWCVPIHSPVLASALSRNLISINCQEVEKRKRISSVSTFLEKSLQNSNSLPTPSFRHEKLRRTDTNDSQSIYFEQYSAKSDKGIEAVTNNFRVKPRLFAPFYEAARLELEQRLASSADCLYDNVGDFFCEYPWETTSNVNESCEPLAEIDDEVVDSLRQKLYAIVQSGLVKRAMLCGCKFHRKKAVNLVALKLVREANLDDSSIQLLVDPWLFVEVGDIVRRIASVEEIYDKLPIPVTAPSKKCPHLMTASLPASMYHRQESSLK